MDKKAHSPVLDGTEACGGRFFGVHVVRDRSSARPRAYVLLDVKDDSGNTVLEHGLDLPGARVLIGLLTHAARAVENYENLED